MKMRNFWSIAFLCFLDLFRQSICKEVLIKEATFSNFWFKQAFKLAGKGEKWTTMGVNEDGAETCSNGDDAEIWLLTKTVPESANGTLHEVQLHIEIEAQLEKCKSKECFKDSFELYRYIGNGEPQVPFNPRNFDKATRRKERQKERQYFQSNFTYLGNITGNTTTRERVNTIITFNLKEFRRITFAIKSRGACGRVTRMKVYYYACEKKFIKNVMFKNTLSPPNGNKTGFGNCSFNSLLVTSMDNLRAYCHINGTWSTNGDIEWCRCNKGYYESADHGCLINTRTSISIVTILVGVGVFLVIILNVLFGTLIYKRRHGTPKLATSVTIPVDAIEMKNDLVEDPRNNNQVSDPIAPYYEEVHIYEELNFDIHRHEDERKTDCQIPPNDEIASYEETQMPERSAGYTEPNIHRHDGTETNYQPLLKRDSGYVIPAHLETSPYEEPQMSTPGGNDERETKNDTFQQLLKSDYAILADDCKIAPYREEEQISRRPDYSELDNNRHDERETKYAYQPRLDGDSDYVIPAYAEMTPNEEAQMSTSPDKTEINKNRPDEKETKYATVKT